ncbi:MAG: hypothetical protein RR602_08150 [Longicatena sp.]
MPRSGGRVKIQISKITSPRAEEIIANSNALPIEGTKKPKKLFFDFLTI